MLADLTTEGSPVYRPTSESLALALLGLQPVLEANIVDVADTTTAFADREQGVVNGIAAIPAKSAERRIIFFYDRRRIIHHRSFLFLVSIRCFSLFLLLLFFNFFRSNIVDILLCLGAITTLVLWGSLLDVNLVPFSLFLGGFSCLSIIIFLLLLVFSILLLSIVISTI